MSLLISGEKALNNPKIRYVRKSNIEKVGENMLGTGLVHIYYGDGKGKTTAAMGQAIRAAGSGLKVLVFQFMKDNSSSERKALEMIPNITLLPGKRHTKFYNQMNSEEKAEYRHYNTKALDEIAKFCINFDVLVMDEAVCAVDLGLLSEEKLVKFVKHKPRGLEIVMTGHHMTDALFECADYVTEMTKVKHPYDTGRSAREGIEF